MNDFTFEEQNLVCIYNSSGTRAGVIAALTEMRGYLEPDEDELRTLTDSALAHPGVEHIYGLLAQGGGKLLQGGRLTAAEEDAGVHVADDGVGVVLVDRL